jgi:hypothetical protein
MHSPCPDSRAAVPAYFWLRTVCYVDVLAVEVGEGVVPAAFLTEDIYLQMHRDVCKNEE